jgi:hypothetical protein
VTANDCSVYRKRACPQIKCTTRVTRCSSAGGKVSKYSAVVSYHPASDDCIHPVSSWVRSKNSYEHTLMIRTIQMRLIRPLAKCGTHLDSSTMNRMDIPRISQMRFNTPPFVATGLIRYGSLCYYQISTTARQ